MTDAHYDDAVPAERVPESGQIKRWRAEFPYHWDADDLVSRRRFLQFTVYTSGALFSGSSLLTTDEIETRFGRPVRDLVEAIRQVMRLRELHERASSLADGSQVEVLRRMMARYRVDARLYRRTPPLARSAMPSCRIFAPSFARA